jgi:hypothetical protein
MCSCIALSLKTGNLPLKHSMIIYDIFTLWLTGDGLHSNNHTSTLKTWEDFNETEFVMDFHDLLTVSILDFRSEKTVC